MGLHPKDPCRLAKKRMLPHSLADEEMVRVVTEKGAKKQRSLSGQKKKPRTFKLKEGVYKREFSRQLEKGISTTSESLGVEKEPVVI